MYAYASDFLTITLLWHGFHDANRMGDGNQILTYWKFIAAIFNHTRHCNYAKEAFLLLAQSSLLSIRQVAEIKCDQILENHPYGRA